MSSGKAAQDEVQQLWPFQEWRGLQCLDHESEMLALCNVATSGSSSEVYWRQTI